MTDSDGSDHHLVRRRRRFGGRAAGAGSDRAECSFMSAIYLNLGCGLQAADGWVNIDRSPNLMLDRVPLLKKTLRRIGILQPAHMVSWPTNIKMMNVLKRFEYGDASIDAIYSSHMLEHLYFEQARTVLRECYRVLRPGGILRLALPDGAEFARMLVEPEDGADLATAGLRFSEQLLMHPFQPPTRKQRLVSMLASPPHRWQPTGPLVLHMLREAGFSDPRECNFLEGHLPDLESVEHREKGLFLEAIR